MRWIILAFALLFSTAASAQCSGVAGANTFCGNPTGSPQVGSYQPIPAFPSVSLDTLCSTNSNSLIRLAGLWQCMAYSAQFGTGATLSIASLSYSLLTGVPSLLPLATTTVNYYVNADASNPQTCGPAGISSCVAGVDSGACLTPASACNTYIYLSTKLYNIGYGLQVVNIYYAHNTGSTNYDVTCTGGSWIGAGVINIIGDSSAGASTTVIKDPLNGYGMQAKDGCILSIAYLDFADPSNNAAGHIIVGATGGFGHVDAANIILGATLGTKVTAGVLGSFTATGPVTSVGNANIESIASDGGVVDWGGQTVTESGTPAYATANAYMVNGGVIKATNTTYSGAATGLRCIINGPLNLGGYDPNAVFPGNSNCVANEYIGNLGIQNGLTFGYGTQYAPLQSGGGVNAKDTWGAPVVQLSPVLYANLASPQSLGMIAVINDGKASNCGDSACTTWGTTVSGGTGALKIMIWNNGSVWTLYGK